MIELVTQSFALCLAVWRESLVGSAIIVGAACAGWWMAADDRRLFTRAIRWWLGVVVRPLLSSRSWLRRTLVIAVNNSVVCGLMIAAGAIPWLGWVAVVCVGLSLGMAVRLLTAEDAFADADVQVRELEAVETTDVGRAPRRRHSSATAVGFAINLLEVPVIMVSAGFALRQGAAGDSITLSSVMQAYGLLLVPTLFTAAGGESLWMGTSEVLGPSGAAAGE